MMTWNGNKSIMRNYSRAATGIAEKTLARDNYTPWLANESARLTLFNRESTSRSYTIRSLGKLGINTTVARNISEQIDAQRPALCQALIGKSSSALQAVNDDIRTLNRGFREHVAAVRAAREIELKRDAMMAMG
jgi:hypothetical protein